MNDDGWTVFFYWSCTAIAFGLFLWMLGSTSCSKAAPSPTEQYQVYVHMTFNKLSAEQVESLRGSLCGYPACSIGMEVDTLRGDTFLLGSIQDLVLSVQDTNGFVESRTQPEAE